MKQIGNFYIDKQTKQIKYERKIFVEYMWLEKSLFP